MASKLKQHEGSALIEEAKCFPVHFQTLSVTCMYGNTQKHIWIHKQKTDNSAAIWIGDGGATGIKGDKDTLAYE